MTTYDGVMIGLILAGMIWGAIRGMTWQVASIASLALAYFGAHKVSAYVAPFIPGEPIVQRSGSMLAAYVIISAGVYFVAWTVRATLKKLKFEAYDRHLGMVLGGLEGALLGIVGTVFVTSLVPGSRSAIFDSRSGRVVAKVMDAAGPALPEEVRTVIAPFFDGAAAPGTKLASPEKDTDPETTPSTTPSDGSTLRDLAKGARSRVGKAVGDAVRSEVERLGENSDEETVPSVDDREINLTQVLKRASLVGSGGEAKSLIADGFVKVNGEVETRKRRQMAVGDIIEIEGGPSLVLVRDEGEPAP